MKTITFYSYKGGVGRTLALANIAKRLAEFGKKVCLIDFDLEAPGLHHKFKENINNNRINPGIVDYIKYFNCNNSTPKTLKNYITPIEFKNKNYKDIDFIAAGNVYSDEYWKTLFSIDWVSMFYKKNSQGVALFVDLKERIKKELKPDYLLIDSRTGISEISGITMSLFADELVLLTVKNDENIQGLKQIIKTLAQPENTLNGKLPKLNFVLCRIPFFERPDEKIIEIRAINEVDRDLNTFIKGLNLSNQFDKLFIIHSDPTLEIEEKLLMGYHFQKDEDSKQIIQRKLRIKSPIASDYLELFEELTKDKLTPKEKLIFNNIKKAEFIIEKARNTLDNNKKIELLAEAILLNPKSDVAYWLLSSCYYYNEDFNTALDNINVAIELKQDWNVYLCLKAAIYKEVGLIIDAENLLKEILRRDEKSFLAHVILGKLYYDKKKYNEALNVYLKLLSFYPDYISGYNSVANTYRILKNHQKAFEYIYKALELNPKDYLSTGTLAEIYAQLGNDNEFYKNFELSLSFGMPLKSIKSIIKKEEVYKPYLKVSKFINLLKKYHPDIELE
jgi:MinD-like ATPase involved in chromosome partitioning or flagellar assembly